MELPSIAALFTQTTQAVASVMGLIPRIFTRVSPQDTRLLFAFNGRSQHWPGMGQELYAREPAFREAIQQYDTVLRQMVGISVLPNFEGAREEVFAADDMRYGMTAIQIALLELWKANNVEPAAVLGVSLGEVTAVYAAGGLTLTDVIRICSSSTLLYELETKEFVTLFLPTDMATAQAIGAVSPVGLYPIYQAGPRDVIAVCHFRDYPVAGAFLESHGLAWRLMDELTYWPSHTPLIRRHRSVLLAQLQKITPKPLLRGYYSACRGQLIPAGTLLLPDFWYDVLQLPVLLYPALEAMLKTNFTAILHVGTHPFLRGQLQNSAFSIKENHVLLDSMRSGSPEVETFQATRRQLGQLGVVTQNAAQPQPGPS